MKYDFQKNIYPIALLLLVFFHGCHSLPPSTPAGPDEDSFQPGVGLWEEISMPSDLLGDWYRGGKLELAVEKDTLRLSGVWSLIQSVEKSDSYYRIIHVIETQYYATYFLNLTEESVEVVEAKGFATDAGGASVLSEIESRHTLTSTNPWIPAGMPGDLQGNWHIHDGNMEMVIDRESLVLDGGLWEIDSMQTNRTVDRLILRSGENYKSLYFSDIAEYTMEVLLIDGKADIQDRYGRIPGDWKTLNKWWDFIEKCRLYQGSRWNYSYCYWKYINEVDNTSSPRDSILQSDSLKGQFELEITSSTMQGATGSLTLQATFQIAEEKSRYFHAQINGDIQILSDSSWSKAGVTEIEQYEIVLENDTLWYRTEEGEVFFASAKIQHEAIINIRAFVYPFTFPREDFPEGRDIFTRVQFPQTSLSSVVFGLGTEKTVLFTLGNGFQYVHYFYYDCDVPRRSGKDQYYIPPKPHTRETLFEYELLDFTPGH